MVHLKIKRMKNFIYILAVCTAILVSLDSCYYDKADQISAFVCDTTAITYSETVQSIITNNCIECHGAGGIANPKLDTYEQVSTNINFILGSIRHEPNSPNMPQNRSKLNPCYIRQIEIWAADGTPNN